MDDSYDLSHLFNDDKFEYITIPIISDYDKENYEKYYDTFEDYEEAIKYTPGVTSPLYDIMHQSSHRKEKCRHAHVSIWPVIII